jgi:hypothetical protein
MFYEALGILGALVFIACDIPYLIDTIQSKIKPHRVTWGVVFLLNTIGFANQLASGASNSLWLFGAAVLMTGAIFLASLKNGVGGHTKQDIIAIVASAIGLALWALFNSPIFSIFANIFVATVALLPTYTKAKKHPETETKIAWLGGAIGALLATISVGTLNWHLLILPGASTLLQGYMVYILYLRPRRLAPK